MLSKRSRVSLSQLLDLFPANWIAVFLEKHGVEASRSNRDLEYSEYMKEDLSNLVEELLGKAEPSAAVSIAEEVVRTTRSLRAKTTRAESEYDQRYEDLEICLRLDGYLIEDGRLLRAEPDLEGGAAVEDDLTRELTTCSLAEAREIIRLLNKSAEAFRKSEPDFVGSLTNARVALQTLATAISESMGSRPAGFDERKWGQVLAHLRKSGFLTDEEEKGVAGVFTFVSPGSHKPVGLTETEMVRLGRSLAMSMCYFLVKKFNGMNVR